MRKLHLLAQSSGYGVAFGDNNVATKLNGGKSRVRRKAINTTHDVSVSFLLDKRQYEYLMAFYRTVTQRGALPFMMDIITDNGIIQTHKVLIKQNTFKLNQVQGEAFFVGMTVEAEPTTQKADNDNVVIDSYEHNRPLPNPGQTPGFFNIREIGETETGMPDGIYRINGDVVMSLTDAAGRIYQTRYTRNGVQTRYYDGSWSGWLEMGAKRVIRRYTAAHKTTGEKVGETDGDEYTDPLPDGIYDFITYEVYADGTQAQVKKERKRIALSQGSLTTQSAKNAVKLSWTIPENEGGYTEIWMARTNDISDASIINAVSYPILEYTFSGADPANKYFFWVRAINSAGVAGNYIGPVEGKAMPETELDLSKIKTELDKMIEQIQADTDRKLQEFNAGLAQKMKDTIAATKINGNMIVNGAGIFKSIQAGTIDAVFLKANTITAAMLKAGIITADHIKASAITSDKIASKAITTEKLNVNKLSAISANMGDLTAGSITLGDGKIKLNNDGSFILRSGDTGGRVEHKPYGVYVYDEEGNLVNILGRRRP